MNIYSLKNTSRMYNKNMMLWVITDLLGALLDIIRDSIYAYIRIVREGLTVFVKAAIILINYMKSLADKSVIPSIFEFNLFLFTVSITILFDFIVIVSSFFLFLSNICINTSRLTQTTAKDLQKRYTWLNG
jgi:hypothetical protein